MPKISVIIPVYNVAPYLAQCLDTLLSQTLRDIEIICVDDKSTDNSLNVLHQYAEKDSRIHVIALEVNSGVSVARNTGIDFATGDYLGFIDPDDYIDINFYEQLYNNVIVHGCDIAKATLKIYPYKGNPYIDDSVNKEIKKFGKWRFRYQWVTGLYKHAMIKNNNIRFKTDLTSGEDTLFLFECVQAANEICLCQDTIYHYIRRQDSLDAQILCPTDIMSKLDSTTILCNLYNNAYMSETEYMYLYTKRVIFVLSLLNRNTAYKIKQRIMETCIILYTLCNNKTSLIRELRKTGQVGNRMIEFIQSCDSEGLLKFVLQNSQSIQSTRKFKICLLGSIPFLRMRISKTSITFKLFGIKILKIKRYE